MKLESNQYDRKLKFDHVMTDEEFQDYLYSRLEKWPKESTPISRWFVEHLAIQIDVLQEDNMELTAKEITISLISALRLMEKAYGEGMLTNNPTNGG